MFESSNATLQTRLHDANENHRVLKERMVANDEQRQAQFDETMAALRVQRDAAQSSCDQEKQARLVMEGRVDGLTSTRDSLIEENERQQGELEAAQAALARAMEGRPLTVDHWSQTLVSGKDLQKALQAPAASASNSSWEGPPATAEQQGRAKVESDRLKQKLAEAMAEMEIQRDELNELRQSTAQLAEKSRLLDSVGKALEEREAELAISETQLAESREATARVQCPSERAIVLAVVGCRAFPI